MDLETPKTISGRHLLRPLQVDLAKREQEAEVVVVIARRALRAK
jgi:hypothetical protein